MPRIIPGAMVCRKKCTEGCTICIDRIMNGCMICWGGRSGVGFGMIRVERLGIERVWTMVRWRDEFSLH
jgi:hypothetical protein